MILGFIFAILAGLVWSIGNVIDKTVVSKYIKNPIFILFIISLISFVVGILILAFDYQPLAYRDWLFVLAASFFYILGNLTYLYALKREESSRVVPLFALANVFVPILAAIFLGEIFGGKQYLGIILVVFGSLLILARGNLISSLKSKGLYLMLISSFSFSAPDIINKWLLRRYDYWVVFGYVRILLGLFGLLILLFYFSEIKNCLKNTGRNYLGLISGSQILSVAGALLFIISMSYWFVTLTETVSSSQYIFLLLWIIFLSRFKPHILAEELSRKIMRQKIISIILIIVGIYLVS